MGDSTRAQAVAKLRAFGKKIGYPDKWRDYSKLAVDRQDFAGNVVRARPYLAAWDYRPHQQAGGQSRVAHDGAHRERVVQPDL